jgi:hypothetical protein
MSTPDGIATYRRVARMLDHHLAAWLDDDSVTSDIVANQPKTREESK